MKSRDYYRILEVPPGASGDEIKQAFRRLARRYHPDVSSETEAEELFKRLNEAYEVLGDRDRRAAYDRSAPGRMRPPMVMRSPPIGHRAGDALPLTSRRRGVDDQGIRPRRKRLFKPGQACPSA